MDLRTTIKVGVTCVVTTLAATSAQAAPEYRQILSCGDGGAIVDVDLNAPRNAQIVIRDGQALEALRAGGVLEEPFPTQTGFDRAQGRVVYIPNPMELTLQGTQNNRLTEQGFTGLETYSELSIYKRYKVRTDFGPFLRHRYRVFAYPEAGGLKLRVDEEIRPFSGCSVHIPHPQGYTSDCTNAGGQNVSFGGEYHTGRAEWFFPNCRAQ